MRIVQVILVVVALLGLYLLASRGFQQRLAEKDREISQLRNQLQERITPKAALPNHQLKTIDPPTAIQEEAKGEHPPKKLSKEQWRVNYLTSQVERYLPLLSEEREQLAAAFMDGRTPANLGEILGEERARNFIEFKNQAQEKIAEEELQSNLFRLSRKLALTKTEEQELEHALRSARLALRPSYEAIRAQSDEAMALHSSPPADDGARLRELYDLLSRQVKETKQLESTLLFEQLQGLLGDEKLNALIEELANRPT